MSIIETLLDDLKGLLDFFTKIMDFVLGYFPFEEDDSDGNDQSVLWW